MSRPGLSRQALDRICRAYRAGISPNIELQLDPIIGWVVRLSKKSSSISASEISVSADPIILIQEREGLNTNLDVVLSISKDSSVDDALLIRNSITLLDGEDVSLTVIPESREAYFVTAWLEHEENTISLSLGIIYGSRHEVSETAKRRITEILDDTCKKETSRDTPLFFIQPFFIRPPKELPILDKLKDLDTERTNSGVERH